MAQACKGWLDCGRSRDPPASQIPTPSLHNEEQLLELLEQNAQSGNFLRGISELNLRSCGITSEGIIKLLFYISKHDLNPSVLDLSGNKIDDVGIEALCDALAQKLRLKYVELAKNSITDQGCRILSKAIRREDCSLLYLGLYGNPITSAGVGYFCEAISTVRNFSCKLKGLNLGALRGISFSDIHGLLEGSLETLSLCSIVDHCTDPYLEVDSRSLETLCSPWCNIKRLELAFNVLADHSVHTLIQVISSETCQIHHLDLQENLISETAFYNLVEALKNPNCKVECLALSQVLVDSERLGDNKIQYLVEHALKDKDCKISTLILCNNMFGDEGLMALAEAIFPRGKLVGLDIRHNPYTQNGLCQFKEMLGAAESSLHNPIYLGCKCHGQHHRLLTLPNETCEDENEEMSEMHLIVTTVTVYVQKESPICLRIEVGEQAF